MPDLKAYYSFRHTLEYRVAQLRNRIAWIDYQNGTRELYMQDLPEGSRTLVNTSERDDGQPVHLVDLSPSGRLLLVTRGHTLSDAATANPRHKTIAPTTSLELFDLERAMPGKPGVLQQEVVINTPRYNSATALITPDEQSVIWASKGAVYSQPVAGGEVSKLFSVRGTVQSLSWAPDQHALAFTCQRNEHSLLGLFTPGRDRVKWISPGFDRDLAPVWAADSRHLAFLRFHGPEMDIAEQLFTDFADSFSVMIMNANNKRVSPVWQGSLEEQAGFSQQYGYRPLTWLDHDRLLFSHDACGWDHIYQFSLADNLCTPLSEGSWLVQDYHASNDGRLLVLSHNRKRRQQYNLDGLDASNDQWIKLKLPADSQYWHPTAGPDSRFLMFMCGNVNSPCKLGYYDRETDTSHTLTTPDSYSHTIASDFITPQSQSLASQDSLVFHNQLFIPSGKGPFPALLNIHGGSWQQSLPGFHPQLDMSFQYAFCQLLAAHGFLVMDINYRGSSGFGKLFRQAPERGWDGASDYQDILAAGQWLTRHPLVDRSRIGVLGESWGGYLSALALARDSGLFRVGAVINGCHNFPREMRRAHWGSRMFSSDEGESATESIARAKIAEDCSPWGWLEHWMSPVLLIHGDDNRQIDFSESLYLAHALRCRSVNVETLVLPDEGHQLLLHDSRLTTSRKVLAFLRKHLHPNM